MKAAWFALILLLGLSAGRTWAQDCHPPGSFYRTSAIRGSLVMQPGAGAECDLLATLDAGSSSPGGAFAWYRLSSPVTSQWRISFRIEPSKWPGYFDSIGILAVAAQSPYPPVGGTATLAHLELFGPSGSGAPHTLILNFACPADLYPACVAQSTNGLSPGDLVRIELNIGAGSSGYARWWINADFSDPPTGEYDDLDNAAWGGVSSVALGALQPFGRLAEDGAQVRLYDIDAPDDALFASGMEE